VTDILSPFFGHFFTDKTLKPLTLVQLDSASDSVRIAIGTPGTRLSGVPGAMGQNVLTSGIDLLALASNTVLKLGDEVVLRLTGLRSPCKQRETLVIARLPDLTPPVEPPKCLSYRRRLRMPGQLI